MANAGAILMAQRAVWQNHRPGAGRFARPPRAPKDAIGGCRRHCISVNIRITFVIYYGLSDFLELAPMPRDPGRRPYRQEDEKMSLFKALVAFMNGVCSAFGVTPEVIEARRVAQHVQPESFAERAARVRCMIVS